LPPRLGRFLPRYRHMTDAEVFSHRFRLGEAQELVARQHGFESWQALKKGLPIMSDYPALTTSKATIVAAEPALFVADIKASINFFTEKLGFSIAFVYGEPPFYAQVKRDAAQINLRCVDRPVIDPAVREREELLSAVMTVASADEIKQLFLEIQGKNVAFFQPLKTQPWGARNFIIKDPDGNLLLFAGPAK